MPSDVYWKLPIKFIGIGSSIGKNWKYWNMQIFQYLMYIRSFQSNFLDIGYSNWKLPMEASNTSNTKIRKQNSCNTYTACIACVEKLENDELLKNTFTNKKPQVKNHLKNYSYFQEKIGSQEELNDIINLTDNEIEETNQNGKKKKELQQNQVKFLDSNASPIETDSEVLVEEIDDIDENNTFITSKHWEQELN
ncbi:9960_t:CDS:2, partial [Funneliformis mosseae]